MALLSVVGQRAAKVVAQDCVPFSVMEWGSQQHFWFLEQFGAGSAYVNAGAYRLNEVVSRHEVLRPRFEDGEPIQVVDLPGVPAGHA